MNIGKHKVILITKVIFVFIGGLLFYGLYIDVFSGFRSLRESNSIIEVLTNLLILGAFAVLLELSGAFLARLFNLSSQKNSFVRIILALSIVIIIVGVLYMIAL